MSMVIDSVEIIKHKNDYLIGLMFLYEDEEELEILEFLDIRDELISIVPI